MLSRRTFLGTVAALAAGSRVAPAAAPRLMIFPAVLPLLRELRTMKVSNPRRLGVITFIEEPGRDDGDTILMGRRLCTRRYIAALREALGEEPKEVVH